MVSKKSKMTTVKHLFFDLDHTLWDFEKNSALTFEKIFKIHKIDINIEVFLEKYVPLNVQFWKLYREEKITKEELRYQRLKTSFDEVGYYVSDEKIDMLANEYINYLSTFSNVFEGTFEILEYLKPKYQLHIITNGFKEIQYKKLTVSKLLPYFNKIITSESVGVKKPNPKIFEHALLVANTKKDEVIMIGDSIEADIEGALNFGVKAIHCNFESKRIHNQNFISIYNLMQLKEFL